MLIVSCTTVTILQSLWDILYTWYVKLSTSTFELDDIKEPQMSCQSQSPLPLWRAKNNQTSRPAQSASLRHQTHSKLHIFLANSHFKTFIKCAISGEFQVNFSKAFTVMSITSSWFETSPEFWQMSNNYNFSLLCLGIKGSEYWVLSIEYWELSKRRGLTPWNQNL